MITVRVNATALSPLNNQTAVRTHGYNSMEQFECSTYKQALALIGYFQGRESTNQIYVWFPVPNVRSEAMFPGEPSELDTLEYFWTSPKWVGGNSWSCLDPYLPEETCEHGLSAWLCEGPNHYPADH